MTTKTVGEILRKIETMQKHYKSLEKMKERVRTDDKVAKYVAENLNLYYNDLTDICKSLLDDIYYLQNKLESCEVEM